MHKEKPPKLYNDKNCEELLFLLNDNKIRDTINFCNSPYLYWEDVKNKISKKLISNTEFWHLLKMTRFLTQYKINFGKYNFTFNLNSEIYEYLHILDTTFNQSFEEYNLKNNNINYDALYNEALALSTIESTSINIEQASEFLRKSNKPKNKNEKLVLNNFLALDYIFNSSNIVMNKEEFCYIHKIITHKTLKNSYDEGRFRGSKDSNFYDLSKVENIFNKPKFDEIDEIINQLCSFFNDDNYFNFFIHPIIKAIIINFVITYTYPFIDGNIQTSRLLMYGYLIKKGYNLTKYLSISKIINKNIKKYELSYLKSEYDDNNLTYFIIFNLKMIIEAKEEFFNKEEKAKDKINKIYDLMNSYNLSKNEALIFEEIKDKKDYVLTVIEVQNLISVSNQTARTALDNLCKKEILSKRKLKSNKFGYILHN